MIAGGVLGGQLSPSSPVEHYYQADREQNRRNIKTLLAMGVEKFYLGHGGPVTRSDVMQSSGNNAQRVFFVVAMVVGAADGRTGPSESFMSETS